MDTKPNSNCVVVTSHNKLPKVPESDFPAKAKEVLRQADRGHQTALTDGDGHVTTIVGLNGHRFLPDPTPDPLDEVLELALSLRKAEGKKTV